MQVAQKSIGWIFLAIALLLGEQTRVEAAPITFNTALPVGKGEFIWREKFFRRIREDETAFPDRQVEINGITTAIGYGVTSVWALFGVLPLLDRQLEVSTSAGRIQRETQGIGDLQLFARYTLFKKDALGKTFRLAPLFGVVVPTGKDDDTDAFGRLPRTLQTGTGAWGGFAGLVATYSTGSYQLDTQLVYLDQGSDEGFQAGAVSRLDLSFQYRLRPRKIDRDTKGFLYGVLESNLVKTERDQVNEQAVADSGGTQWFLSPGIQYITRRWVWEFAVQLPVSQNMNGNAIRDDYILHAGFRRNF